MSTTVLQNASQPNSEQPAEPTQDKNETIEVKAEHLNYLAKSIKSLESKDEKTYLLMLEKLIYLTLEFLKKNYNSQITFSPSNEMVLYVEKMNKRAVDTFRESNYTESAKIVSSCIDLLSQENMVKVYDNRQKLYESKILAYNNLSCIYNVTKKYDLSAKVISSALQLEEELAAANHGQSELSIISTYFNYSTILSQANRRNETLAALEKGFEYMRKVEARKNLDDSERIHLKNLRISGLFMMGKEHENKGESTKAKSTLEEALKLAKEQKKQNVIDKIEQALSNMKKH